MPAYKPLTEEQVNSIAAKYYEDVKGQSQYQKDPRMLLVGGQPGAGKSYAAMLAGQELDNAGGFVRVDADRMREQIPTGINKPSSQETQDDASRLVRALRGLAIKDRRNILEEGTYRNPASVDSFIKDKQGSPQKTENKAR